jgi:hypothetical protein
MMPRKVVNLYAAKTQLSKLVDAGGRPYRPYRMSW